MTTLAAFLDYYPLVARGFFITEGLGLSHYRANTSPAVTGTGWGAMLGLGYDLRVSRKVSLTPMASYAAASGGTSGIPPVLRVSVDLEDPRSS
jgi:hypothetical protein